MYKHVYSGWSLGAILEREIETAQEDFWRWQYPQVSSEMVRASLVKRIEQKVDIGAWGRLEVTTVITGPRRWHRWVQWNRYTPEILDEDVATENL